MLRQLFCICNDKLSKFNPMAAEAIRYFNDTVHGTRIERRYRPRIVIPPAQTEASSRIFTAEPLPLEVKR